MDREDRLRSGLQREMENVRVAPEMRARIDARLRRPMWRGPALAVSVALLAVAAGLVTWLVAGSRDVRQEVVAPPTETAEASPETGLRCFVEARRVRDFDAARACMTDRYASTITDPLQIIGASSPSVERATIVSSSASDERVVFDVLTYWGTSTGISFVSEEIVEVVRDSDRWLVDRWEEGRLVSVETTTEVGLHYLAPGDRPDCASDDAGFVSIGRVVPTEPVVDDLGLSLVRELFTGPWEHEGAASAVFPAGARVNSVRVADGVAHVELNDVGAQAAECFFAHEALRASITALPGVDAVRVTRTSPGPSPEPDV